MSNDENERDGQIKTFSAPSDLLAAINEVAGTAFEGNFSQAVRHLLRRGLACVCGDHSVSPDGRSVTPASPVPSCRTVNPTADVRIRQGEKQS
jgi:hypothetical protein